MPVFLLSLISTRQEKRHYPDTSASVLWVNQQTLETKDTLSFRWNGHPIRKAYPTATLHVWADHLESRRRWKFRYPIINGVAVGDLAMSASLPPGTYAINFLASDQFFEVEGRVKKVKVKTAMNHKTRQRDTIIVYEYPKLTHGVMDYYLLGKEGILYEGILPVGAQGEFRIPRIVFGDSAQLVLDPGKGKGAYWIDVQTPLDSSFTPFYAETRFVRLRDPGQPDTSTWAADTASYEFGFEDPRFIEMLTEIKIKGKTNAEKFEDAFVSGLFRDFPGTQTLESLDSDEIMRFGDVFTYLRSNMAGLIQQGSGISSQFWWRGAPVQFFLNEFPVTPDVIATLPPMDVALIKAYPPPAAVGTMVSGGAIGVYTKRGVYEKDQNKPRYHFMVRGFTHGLARWGE